VRTSRLRAVGCYKASDDVFRVLIEITELGPRHLASNSKPSRNIANVSKRHSADKFVFTAYYIAFGPHGPRRPPPPDEGRKVFLLSAGVIAGAFAVFAFTRMFANPVRPRTMTKEWQEATEEYLKVRSLLSESLDSSVAVLTLYRPKEPSPSLVTRE
jgi:hypothetical protein